MRWRIPLLLILAAFVVVSCDRQPTEPNVSAEATSPAMNFTNGPELAGVVSRSDHAGWIITDWTRDETEKQGEQWTIFMGWGIDDYHKSCGGSGPSNPWVTQTINKNGIEHSMNQDMDVTVFPFMEFFGNYLSAPDPSTALWYASCETTRIASGTAHGVDNITPAGDYFTVNGKIDYLGETYKLKYSWKFFAKGGSRRTLRIW